MKRVSIRFKRSGTVTWASPTGSNSECVGVKEGEILEKVKVEPTEGLSATWESTITDKRGWTISLENAVFEILKTEKQILDGIVRSAKELYGEDHKGHPYGVLLAVKALLDFRADSCHGVPSLAAVGKEWERASQLVAKAAEEIEP